MLPDRYNLVDHYPLGSDSGMVLLGEAVPHWISVECTGSASIYLTNRATPTGEDVGIQLADKDSIVLFTCQLKVKVPVNANTMLTRRIGPSAIRGTPLRWAGSGLLMEAAGLKDKANVNRWRPQSVLVQWATGESCQLEWDNSKQPQNAFNLGVNTSKMDVKDQPTKILISNGPPSSTHGWFVLS